MNRTVKESSSNYDFNSTQGTPTMNGTMPLSEQVMWCVALALVAVAIIVGNCMTIAVFTKRKLLRMRANYFLVTLAVADLMVGTFAVPMYIHQLISYWKNNAEGTYIAYKAVDIFTAFSSIFALTIIALERLYAVMCPLRHRLTSKKAYYKLIAVVWILSLLVAVLYFMNGFKVFKYKIFFYFVIFFIFTSLLLICVAYVLVWANVSYHKREKPKRESRYQEEIDQMKRSAQEKQLVTTLLIITLVFVLTWIPFYILNIVVFLNDDWESSHIPYEVFAFTKLLHYSNSFANPIVYSIRIPKFTRTLLGSLRRRKTALFESLRLS
ncbi:substance-P receptor-like [Stylophora pistillata]|uniref:substance-P receptor-like n=1 Tax=Stylophora pistillata TaxID=50429 RepID=UPI000C0454D5|nr:substance-P receptor-like [Stylophora pistillata]XP_022789176.1 substance-P receptor-like [Stylophora pistillata]XP_022789177.1 substance-P receptor-like [Stylophora pistillata]XP_022789178.1 substance-P receptor-like [Stylophora pistillata]